MKKLLYIRTISLIFASLSVCLNCATIAVHQTSSLSSGQANDQCAAGSDSYYTIKLDAEPATIIVAFAMVIIGAVFALILVLILVIKIFIKKQDTGQLTQKYRIACYLLASVAFLSTTSAFGYYLGYYIDSMSCNSTNTNSSLFLAVVILSGISTLLLLMIVFMFIAKIQNKYQSTDEISSKVEVQMQSRQVNEEDHIKVVLNGKQPIGSFRVQKNNESLNQGKSNLQYPLLDKRKEFNRKLEVVNPAYNFQDQEEQDSPQILSFFTKQQPKNKYPQTFSQFKNTEQNEPELHSTPYNWTRQNELRKSSKIGHPTLSIEIPNRFMNNNPTPYPASSNNSRSPKREDQYPAFNEPETDVLKTYGPNAGRLKSPSANKQVLTRAQQTNQVSSLRQELRGRYGMK